MGDGTSITKRLSNNALNLTKRDVLGVGALRAPSSFQRASQVSLNLHTPLTANT
jgi:hypothetical protein